MKKAFLRAFPILVLLLLLTMALAACDSLPGGSLGGSTSRATVKFDCADGSTDPYDYGILVGAKLRKPENPTREGYTFVGWSDGNGFWDFDTDVVEEDTVLRAVWTPRRYLISYELGGGENAGGNPLYYTPESEEITLAAPTRRGYTFLGWTGEGVSEPTSSVTIPTGSLGERTYTANWQLNTYTLTFVLGGGTAGGTLPDSYTVRSGEIEIADPERVGYTFLGWSVNGAEPERSLVIDAERAENLSAVAVWQVIRYTITLEGMGGAASTNPTGYTVEDGAITLAAPTRRGYTFLGWTGEGVSEPTLSLTVPAASVGNKTFTAHWEAIEYTLGFDLGGGSVEGVLPDRYTVQTDTITLPTPTRHGYTFLGWLTEGVDVPTVGLTVPVGSVGNRSYTAVWQVTPYTIRLELAGGTLSEVFDGGYDVTTATFTLPTPTRHGYTFLGWMENGEGEAERTVTISLGSVGNRSYTAAFTLNTYTITYVKNGGTAVGTLPSRYTVEDADITLPALTRDGYIFLGWSVNGAEPEAVCVIDTDRAEGLRLEAKFEAIPYTITYRDLMGAENSNPTEYSADTETFALGAPTRPGYTFLGWTFDGQTTPLLRVMISKGSVGDKTFTAHWRLNEYAIKLELGGGSLAGSVPEHYTVEDADIAIPNPTKQGYTFLGWRVNGSSSLVRDYTVKAGSTGKRSLTAVFEAVKYTLTYHGTEGASNPNGAYYTVEDGAITIQAPTKRGYTFLGWTYEGVTEPTAAAVIPAGSVGEKTFTAHWQINTYTLDFVLNGGTAVGTLPSRYTVEDADIAVPNAEKNGYTFLGWRVNGAEPVLSLVIDTEGAEDLSLVAVFELIEYKIEYELNGGTFDKEIEDCYDVETGTVTLPSPEKPGYTFAGWTGEGTDTPTVGLTIPAGSFGDKSYTAVWVIIEYTITLPAGIEIPTTYTVESGDIAIPNPTKRGYTFLGWSVNGSTETVKDYVIKAGSTGDLFFEAKWELNEYTLTVDPDGAVLGVTLPGSYTVESDAILIPAVSKVGYTFLGWRVNGASSLVQDYTVEAGSVGDLTVEAVFEAVKYTLTYHGMEGASNPNGAYYTVEDGVITIQAPTKRGYTFLGWTGDGITEITQELTISASSMQAYTLTAHWQINTYTVTVDPDGGTLGATVPGSYTVEDADITVPNAEKNGYTFLGWRVNGAEPVLSLVIDTDGAEDLSLVAVFELIEYKIEYELNGGSFSVDFEDCYDVETDTVTLPSPEKPGYTFAGWTGEGTDTPTVGLKIPAGSFGDKSYTAVWVIIEYKYEISLGDGQTLPTAYTVESDDIVIPNPTKRGYTFLGWSVNGSTETVKDYVIKAGSTGDLFLEAKWEMTRFTITYENIGTATHTNPTEYTMQSGTITITPPERPGYTFLGWTGAGVTEPTMTLTFSADALSDMVITANWLVYLHPVTYYNTKGVTNPNPVEYVEGAGLSLLSLSADGYTFLGWYDEAGNRVTSIPEDAKEAIILTARWQSTVTGTSGLSYTLSSDGTYYIVGTYSGSAANIVIPSTYNGKPVKEIAANAFSGSCRNYIKTVVISDGVEVIGASAFAGCQYMTSLTIGADVKTIGNKAFSSCRRLENIYFNAVSCGALSSTGNHNTVAFQDVGSSVASCVFTVGKDVRAIPDYLFYVNSSNLSLSPRITSIVFEEGSVLEAIGSRSLYHLGGLTEIQLPSTLKTIGWEAFYYAGLTELTLPEGLTEIGQDAFEYCQSLTKVTIPSTVTKIGSSAFSECRALTAIYYNAVRAADIETSSSNVFRYCGYTSGSITLYIGEKVEYIPSYLFCPYSGSTSYSPYITRIVFSENSSLTEIGKYAFAYVWKLESVTLPASLEKLGEYAFYNCTSLTSADLGGTEEIARYAFSGCTKLEALHLSSSIKTIGQNAFSSCSALTAIHVPSVSTWCGISFYDANANPLRSGTASLYVDGEKLTALIIPEGTEAIGNYAFYGTDIETLVIPASVKRIGDYAFASCKALKSVTLPGVVEIGSSAFQGCSALESVTMPSAETIGSYAFYECKSLTSVSMPAAETIGSSAFYKCEQLASITLGAALEEIGNEAFSYCRALTELSLPASLNYVGSRAFQMCDGLTGVYITDLAAFCETHFDTADANPIYYAQKLYVNGALLTELVVPDTVTKIGIYAFAKYSLLTSVVLPDSVKMIEIGAFSGCEALSSVTIGKSVERIADYAFFGCKSLTSIVLPDSVTEIARYVFQDCTSLASISLGKSVETIGYYAFNNCTSLTAITLPDSLGSLGERAFESCTSLRTVAIGKGLTSIGSYAFRYCYMLESVYFNAANLKSVASSAYLFYRAGKNGDGITLTIGKDVTQIPAYLFHSTSNDSDYAKLVAVELEEGAAPTSIGAYAFYYMKELASVTLPASVTSIGNYAFYYAGLKSVTLPEGLTKLGENAFSYCSSLESVDLGKSLAEMGKNAFYYCSALKEITIPGTCVTVPASAFYRCTSLETVILSEGVTTVGQYAFQECTALVEVTLPSTLTSIGSQAFFGCTLLSDLDLPAGLKTLGDKAFLGCTALKTVTLPASMTSVGYYAFQNCKELTEIVIPEGVTSIGNYAFSGCTALSKVTLPSTLTSIGQYAFQGCSALSEIALPASLGTLNSYAFSGCTALSSLVIPDSVTYVGDHAFSGCTALKTLTVGTGVTTLGNYAFADCTGLTAVNFNAASLTNRSNGNNIFTRAGTAGDGIVFTFGKEITHVPAYLLCPVADNTYSSAMKLSAVVFSEDSLCTSVGEYAFAYTTGLKQITLPAGLTSLGQYAFAYCRDLLSFTLPTGISAVPNYVFRGCTALASVSLHEGVTSIGAYAFYDCQSLPEITIGKNVKSLGSYAFGNCYALTRINLEAESFTTYSSSGYYFTGAGKNAAGITLVIGKHVKEIAPYLFYVGSGAANAPKITSVVFAEDGVLSTIGNQCFYDGIYLRTITIPSTVTTIGNYAFQGCTGLIEVKNLSSLTLTEGTTANGHVAYYAKNVYTATEGESKLVTVDGVVYFVDAEKGYYYAIGAEEGATELTFAGSLDGHSYEILPNAFRGRTDIKKVTFTSGITAIGDYAFYGCSGIEALALPANITSLGQYVFAYCSGVSEIVIPDTVTSIGSYAFYNCTGVKTLVIGKNVSSFGTYAFGNLTSLEVLIVNSAKLPANLGSNNYVFYNAAKNTEGGMTVTFGNEVKTVPSYMFSPASNTTYAPVIKEVVFLEGSVCTTIGNYAFAYAKLYAITLPESLTAIGNQAFAYCYYLREVVINSKSLTDLTTSSQIFYYAGQSGDGFTVTFGPLVERVPAYLFYVGNTSNAPKLLSVTFAEGSVCKTVGQSAFYRNAYLTKVTLPAGLTAIGTDAFRDCTAISEVHVASLADWLAISFAGQTANPASIGTLYIGGEMVPEILVIPEGVTSIGDYSFVGNKTIKSVVFPASLRSIGIYAFYNCSGLTELSVNAETIGHHAFYYLTSLRKLTIGTGVKTIALEAFGSCAALEEIYFLAENCTLDAVGNQYANIFYNAGSGTGEGVAVVIGKDVTALPAYLFAASSASSTPKFASLTFEAGSSCTEIGQYAFSGCAKLEAITLPASVKTVKYLAFSGCTGLTSADLGGSEILEEQAFLGCTSLKEFKADHLTKIDNSAFRGCSALEGFVIGDLVTFVGSTAFKDCTSLRYIALGKSLETIGNDFLSGTTSLTEIYYNVKDFSVINYYNTPFWGAGSADGITLTVGKDVVAIPDYLFYVDSSSYTPAKLKTVVFEEGSACKKIGLEAFAGVKTLKSITLPEGLREIGDYAFLGCTALTDVNLPSTLEIFGLEVFKDCSAIAYSVYGGVNYLGNSENPYLIAVSVADEGEIEHLVIHPDTRIVNDYAFRGYAAIKTVTLGDKLVTVGQYAFYGCSGLEALTIPDSVKTIGLYAFGDCSSLKTLRIGKGVTSFGGSAFYNCTALESIYYNAASVKNTENCTYFSGMTNGAALTVGRDVVEIPAYLFEYANITSLTFEEGSALEKIGKHAFLSTAIAEVALPASLTEIGEGAFRQCKSLTVLTMGDAVTVIGSDAFRDCSALVALKISSGVTRIPGGLLSGCSSLTELTVPFTGMALDITGYEPQYGHLGYIFGSTNYTGSVNVYGYGTSMSYKLYNWYIPTSLTSVTVTGGALNSRAFENCTMLKEVTLTGDVSLIAEGAFTGCSGIKTLTYDLASALISGDYPMSGLSLDTIIIGRDVKSLPDYLFYGAGATTVTFHPECRLETVGAYAFSGNRMTAITLPATVTSLGKGAFMSCTSLVSITLPATVTELADALFKNCSALEAVSGGAVTAIGVETFSGCRALTSFTLPAGITEIPSNAFSGAGLTSVTLPESVTVIGTSAFASCQSLTSVRALGTVAVGSSAFSGCSLLESFTAAGVSGIGSSAFSSCTQLATLTLGTASGEIGSSAFSGCSALTAVTLPEGITAIGSEAFSGTDITVLVIPDSVTSLGDSAFAGTALRTLTLGSGITAIPNGMCYGATALETVTMSEGITSIGQNAFRGCTALTSATLPDSITAIGENAFRNCTVLSFSALPASLKTIGGSAFYGCSGITGKLTIPDSVTSIDYYAFQGCTGITELDTGAGLSSLVWQVFKDCTSLKVVTIGTGMEYIDRRAFEGCTLTHAYFLDTVSNWCYDNPSDNFNPWTVGKSKLTSPTTMATEYLNRGVYDLFIE